MHAYQKTFDASGSQSNCRHPIKKYTWNFGDGSSELVTNQPKINHLYSNKGVYNVTLTIETACHCPSPNTATATKTASVGWADILILKYINKHKRTIFLSAKIGAVVDALKFL